MKIIANNRNNRAKWVFILTIGFLSNNVGAWDREEAERFTLLPKGATNPEAIATDDSGNILVSTFFSGEIHRYTSRGDHIHSVKVQPSSGMLTDLAFQPETGTLLVIDFGAKKILEVSPWSGNATVFSEIPGEKAGPNVLAFDEKGNVYVSDSFQATIWKIPATGGEAVAWLTNDLLSTSSFPGFGANGIAFNNEKTVMYVANTGEDSILKVLIDDNDQPTSVTKFVNGINGPDGLIVDRNNNILIAESFSSQIVVLDQKGKTIAVHGDFEGISRRGSVKGLLFPSDLVIAGNKLFVTNFAIDVTAFGYVQTGTNAYSAQVTRHSIAQIEISD